MFASQPELVLQRTVMIRLLLCLLVLPFGLLATWGAIASSVTTHPDFVFAGICASLAVVILGLFVYLFHRETRRRVSLHEEGIGQQVGSRTTALRWTDIREIWVDAIRVQAGGLLGAAVGAAVHAASSRKGGPLNANTTNITIRLVGDDNSRIVLTSNDKGVVAAFEKIRSRVNPHLLAVASQIVQQGRDATFGPISISLHGVGYGRKEPIRYTEIEAFSLKGGKLRLKKRGSWLDTFSIPIKKIPNVFVLTDLFEQLSVGTGAAVSVKSDFARSAYF